MSYKKLPITFITGNKKKVEEFLSMIVGSPLLQQRYSISHQSLDLEEVQGTSDWIATRKAIQATKQCDTAVLIEDVSLGFNAYKGLPGPYIKDFLDRIGRRGLYQMARAFEDDDDTSATALCTFALGFPSGHVQLFVGECHGHIVAPRGDSAFGWDPIFQPLGYKRTFAEMSLEEKNQISHRARALQRLKDFLEIYEPGE